MWLVVDNDEMSIVNMDTVVLVRVQPYPVGASNFSVVASFFNQSLTYLFHGSKSDCLAVQEKITVSLINGVSVLDLRPVDSPSKLGSLRSCCVIYRNMGVIFSPTGDVDQSGVRWRHSVAEFLVVRKTDTVSEEFANYIVSETFDSGDSFEYDAAKWLANFQGS